MKVTPWEPYSRTQEMVEKIKLDSSKEFIGVGVTAVKSGSIKTASRKCTKNTRRRTSAIKHTKGHA